MGLAGGTELVASHPFDHGAHADLLGAGQGGDQLGLRAALGHEDADVTRELDTLFWS